MRIELLGICRRRIGRSGLSEGIRIGRVEDEHLIRPGSGVVTTVGREI
jgi:hypothetical protein